MASQKNIYWYAVCEHLKFQASERKRSEPFIQTAIATMPERDEKKIQLTKKRKTHTFHQQKIKEKTTSNGDYLAPKSFLKTVVLKTVVQKHKSNLQAYHKAYTVPPTTTKINLKKRFHRPQ